MALATSYIAAADAQATGVNMSTLQEFPIVLEIPGAMANADTAQWTSPTNLDVGLPPRVVQICRHTGGDITNAVNDTWNNSNGDTLIFNIDAGGTNKTSATGKSTIVQYTHALVGVTGGAATAAQVAASLNGDATFKKVAVAVAGLTAQRVTIIPVLPRATIAVIGGTAQTIMQFPGTVADYKNRTYVSQTIGIAGVTGFSWSFVQSTGVLTITNTTGGSINRVMAVIER